MRDGLEHSLAGDPANDLIDDCEVQLEPKQSLRGLQARRKGRSKLCGHSLKKHRPP